MKLASIAVAQFIIVISTLPTLIAGIDEVNNLLRQSLYNVIPSSNSILLKRGIDNENNNENERNMLEIEALDNPVEHDISTDCMVKKNKRTCVLCQNQFNQDVCTHSTCPLGATEESLTNDCTCEIKIGSTSCKSCSYCDNGSQEISFAYNCGTYGESKCCFEKDNLRTCTLCQDSNGQRLCTHATCPVQTQNDDNNACTCKITIGDFVCDRCEYCDLTKTKFAYDCGKYGKDLKCTT